MDYRVSHPDSVPSLNFLHKSYKEPFLEVGQETTCKTGLAAARLQ